jgi:uncharacterized phage protein gp47/JayE
MAASPKVYGPDGVLRETTVYSTTIPNQFYSGVIDSDTVDMEISVRGGAFVSDPDFIVFEGTTFQIPNPAAFGDGLELAAGKNVIRVRAISFSGAVSTSAEIQATLVQQADIGVIATVPTNMSVEQTNDSVLLRIEGVTDPRFRGLNFYASQFSGGGATGYQRVNINIISDFEPEYETQPLASFQSDNALATNPDGTVAADPLYIKVEETQTKGGDLIQNLEDVVLTPELAAAITETEQANLLKTDFVEQFEVPEGTTSIRSSYLLETLVERLFYSFDHNRLAGPTNTPATVPIGAFAALSTDQPLFYVARSIFYDEASLTEVESSNSIEVVGSPTIVTLTIGAFPTVSQLQIQQNTISDLLRTQPEVSLQPGAVIRDVFIDPFSGEVVRIRFLTDFLHRSQAFDTLLAIDGLTPSGNPVPVTNSAYKTALQAAFQLQRPEDVQFLIDQTFAQLAARNGVVRRSGLQARGIVTFFTRATPTRTMVITLGTRVSSGSVTYATTEDSRIPVENSAAYFDPTTGLFSVDVTVQAEQAGVSGNVSRGQISSIISNVPGLAVTNQNRTFGGLGAETNIQLATRARSALASVDVGTEQGIRQAAADQAGVEEANVIEAGNSLMQRDFDPTNSVHVGGKADVWIRGVATGTVSDTFAFVFQEAFDVQFQLIGNPLSLIFRSLDPALSVDNPLSEMLDFQAIGLGFRNATSGSYFSLDGYTVMDYRTIQLAPTQPAVTQGDVVLGDYRYTISRDFVLPRQPVNAVVSVTGQVSGLLPAESVQLWRVSDPLVLGRSAQAGAFIRIVPIDNVPSGELIAVTSEVHVIIGEFNEFLSNLGVSVLTIAVFNNNRTIQYRGPNDPSGISDYTIIPGTQTEATAIRRIPGGNITSGQTLVVDYSYNENFVVEYTTNQVIATTQNAIDNLKGVTYDVLVKDAVATPLDIAATVVKQTGFPTNSIQSGVQTNLESYLRGLPMGSSVRQSDIITVIDQTSGVSFVTTPLTNLARDAGVVIVREPLTTASKGDTTLLLGTPEQPYSSSTVNVWLIEEELNAATTTGGGSENEFRGVFQDENAMTLQTADPDSLQSAPDKAYIIGNEGLSIPGYSDDATLVVLYPTATAAEIATTRQGLTANRLMVALSTDDRPSIHAYTVTYIVSAANEGARNINGSELEYFTLGDLVLTVAEDG